MTLPIISTKLHIPQPPPVLVTRARLTTRLDGGAQGKLILVSAPAGFGKTTLIADWANHLGEGCLVSWVHLDESDNELARFLSYMIATLQVHQPDLGEAALSGLGAMPPAPLELAMTTLINEIDALDRDLILILDDYHLIETRPVHDAIYLMIEHLPARMCLVIITRTDPPLPVHRLRARGQMLELRAEDLRFSHDEARSFLEGLLNYPLSESDIAALDDRIEGWIAGLQMAALSMQGKRDVGEFIAAFSGSHRYIMDYLTEEIYNQQPPYIQKFLLQTSILDRLSGPLCEAVLDSEFSSQDESQKAYSAQQILKHLEQANLFLLPMDDDRQWYRYHRLFATLLRQRLRHTWPDEIPVYFQRASVWSEANGYLEEAVMYALAGGDVQAAAQMVEKHALDLLKVGALSTLSGWLSKLPDELILGHPWLSVYMSWVLLLTGKFENLERYLLAAKGGAQHSHNADDLRGHIIAIRAYALAMRGEAERAYDLAMEALDLLPQNDLTVRSVVTFVLGGINMMRGDILGAIDAMQKAGGAGERAGNVHLGVSALSSAGDLLLSQGKLAEAEQIYGRALKAGTGRSGRPLPIAAGVYSGLAEIHLGRNDLESARQYVETALELAGQWGNPETLVGCYLAQAQVLYREGDTAGARDSLSEAKRLAGTHTLSPGTDERIAAYEALILEGRSDRIGQGSLIEPLTEREIEVLGLIAAGRSNTEIASELIVALGTVKAHTSSIYRKLDVRSRTEAVIRAQEFGLL